MIPKQPVQPILGISIHIAHEPGSDPVLREKKEYKKKINKLIKLQEYTRFGNNMKIFITLYST